MISGRMHLRDGLVLQRAADGTIEIGLALGGDPHNEHTRVVVFTFTEFEFASAVAHAARRGETGETFREALALIQQS